jgi:hypothetical protein
LNYYTGPTFSLDTSGSGTFTFDLEVYEITPDGETQTLIDSGTLTVTTWLAPVITSPLAVIVRTGQNFEYVATATNSPEYFGADAITIGLTPGRAEREHQHRANQRDAHGGRDLDGHRRRHQRLRHGHGGRHVHDLRGTAWNPGDPERPLRLSERG